MATRPQLLRQPRFRDATAVEFAIQEQDKRAVIRFDYFENRGWQFGLSLFESGSRWPPAAIMRHRGNWRKHDYTHDPIKTSTAQTVGMRPILDRASPLPVIPLHAIPIPWSLFAQHPQLSVQAQRQSRLAE